ncbi:putative zinc finger protein 286B [Carassius gibelio]|uniref:putative zinc finger protein 286B n=1 Tax=Carassius gibelio TaxID=101364 RepID=UPI002277FE16|nr:putative zinc finger protein 286B [Carassius gibelio]
MKAQVDVVCCKSVGTDLSMLDIEDFITEICQLKKEVASLEAKLRERGDKLNREDVEQVWVRETDGTEAQDSVWSVRDQRSRDTQDSELSLTLLCYTDAQDHESTDQTSDCNAGEQQMLQTPLKMCSVKLMLIMKAQVDVVCCKSVGTDLSMLDIEDFITEICQLKKEVASLEAKLRERGDKLNREDVEQVWVRETDGTEAQDSVWSVRDQRSRDTQDSELSLTLLCYTDAQDHESTDQTSDCNAGEQQMLQTPLKIYITDCVCQDVEQVWVRETDGTEAQDSVWSVRDQRSRDTQDSELSLTLLCYTDAQDHESTDQTSDCNAGEQQMLQTPLKMCSVKLVDCRNLIESRGEETTTEKQQQHTDEEEEEEDDENNGDGDDEDEDFIPPDVNGGSSSDEDEETLSTSKEQLTAKSFSCSTCGKTMSSESNLKRHERTHTEQKDFSCKICNISFPTAEERRLHSKEHSGKKEFHCEQCGKVFFNHSSLKVHLKTHGEKSFHCSECDKYFSNKGNLDVHKRIHTGERPYKCPHCEKRFSYGSLYKRHVRLHTNERPYQCSECGKTFTNSSSLKSHQKIHSDEKPYQCKHCDKRFRQIANLNCHERIHTGEKPYLCAHCGKSFSDPTHFREHKRIHTGENPYHCSICGKSFKQNTNLIKHQRIHTGERQFKCSQCEKTFARSDVLKVHQRVHTGEKPYSCSICGERFGYLGSFQTHQNKHTKEQTAPESSE